MTIFRILRPLGLLLALLQFTLSHAVAWEWPWSTATVASDSAQLEQNALTIRRLAQATPAILAAQVTQEGQWTFVNAAGETFTAANDVEVRRAFDVLLPEAQSRPSTLLLTGDSLVARRALASPMPKGSDLMLGWGSETFKIEATGSGSSQTYFAQLRPNLLVALTSTADFAEALALLRRPIEALRLRVVSLEPGGPHAFPSTPRVDATAIRPDVDPIDPAFLAASLSTLRGQTAVIVGRIEGDTLTFKPPSGPEGSLPLAPLVAAAASADADMLVLKSSGAQQPGGRNWLWQRVEIKGLDRALGHATLGDFLNALGSPSNRMALTLQRPSGDRTSFEIVQVSGTVAEASTTARIGEVVSETVAGLVGNVVHTGAAGYFRSSARQAELDRRLVPFVPSVVQWIYGTLFVLGVGLAPVSRWWWARLWPKERAEDYANTFGFRAAGAMRVVAFVLLFMPLAALPAASKMLIGLLSRRASGAPRSNPTSG